MDRAGVDERLLFCLAGHAPELAVEVRPPREEALGEATVELAAHRGIPVQVGVIVAPLAQAPLERLRRVRASLGALVEVPARGWLVESLDGVLVDD